MGALYMRNICWHIIPTFASNSVPNAETNRSLVEPLTMTTTMVTPTSERIGENRHVCIEKGEWFDIRKTTQRTRGNEANGVKRTREEKMK